MTIKEIRELAEKSLRTAEGVSKEAGDDAMTADQQSVFDAAMTDYEARMKSADDAQRLADAQKRAEAVVESVVEPRGDAAQATGAAAPAPRELRDLFIAACADPRNIDARDAYVAASVEARDLQTQVSNKGGYLVPPTNFNAELLQDVADQTQMFSLARVITTTGAQAERFPTLANRPTLPTWGTETSAPTDDTAITFGVREFATNPLKSQIKVSEYLLSQSPMNVDSILRGLIGEVFQEGAETAFMTGDGSGKPLGVFTADASGIPTSRDVSTDNTTTAFTADGLTNAMFSIKAQYQSRLTWLFHRLAVRELIQLKDSNGVRLLHPDVSKPGERMLHGRPIVMSEFAPSTFTTGLYVGLVGDFSQYFILQGEQIQIKVSADRSMDTDEIEFHPRWWLDGAPTRPEAFARITLA